MDRVLDCDDRDGDDRDGDDRDGDDRDGDDRDGDAPDGSYYDDMAGDPATESFESRLEPRLARHRKRDLADGFKRNKVVNEVLDKSTVMTLYKMITDGILSGVNGSISAGKESLLFWGLGAGGEDIALKIYLVSTSNFKRRHAYILGDPRFASVRKSTRSVVYLWAKKEFRNLAQCAEAGIPVPRPIHVANNVLAMEFVGSKGVAGRPAARLVHSDVDHDDYLRAMSILEDMYKRARLVHGDYSAYNIFKTDERGLVVFDLGSAVDVRHPNADALLQRDINNITEFFKKKGVEVSGDCAGGVPWGA